MTTGESRTQLPDIVIRSEEDAYAVLELARDNRIEPFGNLIFDGWPSLSIYLQGEKFHQSITPTIMRGLLEFQRGIYQSYATAKYNYPTKRLSEEEKQALEIRVDVKDGSSDFAINFQELAVKLVEQIGGKMEPVQIVITVVSIAVLYFGSSAYKSFLENRKDIRIKEISDETQRKALEALRFAADQETERTRILAELSRRDHRIENITQIARGAQSEIVKAISAGDKATLEGISIDPSVAEMLTRNARRKSAEVRLDGIYRLIKLDWSDPMKFKARVLNTETGLQLDADVQDDSLTGKYKEALREAEWSRSPVALKINAKLVGVDDYRDAVVIAAETYKTSPN